MSDNVGWVRVNILIVFCVIDKKCGFWLFYNHYYFLWWCSWMIYKFEYIIPYVNMSVDVILYVCMYTYLYHRIDRHLSAQSEGELFATEHGSRWRYCSHEDIRSCETWCRCHPWSVQFSSTHFLCVYIVDWRLKSWVMRMRRMKCRLFPYIHGTLHFFCNCLLLLCLTFLALALSLSLSFLLMLCYVMFMFSLTPTLTLTLIHPQPIERWTWSPWSLAGWLSTAPTSTLATPETSVSLNHREHIHSNILHNGDLLAYIHVCTYTYIRLYTYTYPNLHYITYICSSHVVCSGSWTWRVHGRWVGNGSSAVTSCVLQATSRWSHAAARTRLGDDQVRWVFTAPV